MIHFLSGTNHAMSLDCKANTITEMEAYLKNFFPDIDLKKGETKYSWGTGTGYGIYVSPNGVKCDYWLNANGRTLYGVPHVSEKPLLFG